MCRCAYVCVLRVAAARYVLLDNRDDPLRCAGATVVPLGFVLMLLLMLLLTSAAPLRMLLADRLPAL